MNALDKTINVLIIDDSAEDRFVYKNYLQKNEINNFTILESETGQEGLELCKSSPPDCLLLDYNLPDMDGLEILSELSPLKFAVIMLTGEGSQQVAVQSLKMGIKDYLVKGEITPSILTQSIISAVKLFNTEMENELFARELKRSHQALEEFATIASHDLNEPLRKISFYAGKIRALNNSLLEDSSYTYLSSLEASAEKMSLLIKALLNYSRINLRSEPLKSTSLNEIIKSVLSDLEVSIHKKEAQVDVENLPEVEADPTQIYQLFLNLIANGIKFNNRKSPVINITCNNNNDSYWEIQVKDNGIGLESKFEEKIFKPFFRIHQESEYKGTGIGLATCKKIVERHEGTISAVGKPGEGTTFTIRLPKRNLRL